MGSFISPVARSTPPALMEYAGMRLRMPHGFGQVLNGVQQVENGKLRARSVAWRRCLSVKTVTANLAVELATVE